MQEHTAALCPTNSINDLINMVLNLGRKRKRDTLNDTELPFWERTPFPWSDNQSSAWTEFTTNFTVKNENVIYF